MFYMFSVVICKCAADECGMLSPKLLHQVNDRTQTAKQCTETFGGLWTWLSGDFLQLPPVGQPSLAQPVPEIDSIHQSLLQMFPESIAAIAASQAADVESRCFTVRHRFLGADGHPEVRYIFMIHPVKNNNNKDYTSFSQIIIYIYIQILYIFYDIIFTLYLIIHNLHSKKLVGGLEHGFYFPQPDWG